MEQIYTNLDINNMVKELEQSYIGITNKEFIRGSIITHKKYGLISRQEADYLFDKYIKEA